MQGKEMENIRKRGRERKKKQRKAMMQEKRERNEGGENTKKGWKLKRKR